MSLRGDKYETAEEVKFRLEGTVVLYDNAPVYITRVSVPDVGDKGEIARVYFQPLPYLGRGEGKEVRKFLSSKNFELAPFRMGYFNEKGRAIFAARMAVRQNKQGLAQGTVTFSGPKGEKVDMTWGRMVASQGFVDMVNGKYPSFKEAGEMLGVKDVTSVAVSPSFAFIIDHDLEALLLLHKGVRCGIAMKGDRSLKIPPKFHFLKEEMEQHRIPIS